MQSIDNMNFRLYTLLALSFVTLAFFSCDLATQRMNIGMNIENRNIAIEFHDGDIAFRCGSGFMSKMVIAANPKGRYSHVGVIAKVNDRWCVIHEVPYEGRTTADDKIYCEEVDKFFDSNKAISGAIYRFEGLDSIHRATIRQYALQQLSLNTPFDHEYDLEDDSSQYCSELVWRSFLTTGIDISNGNRTYALFPGLSGYYILPSDIETNHSLIQIYHFED